MNIWPQRECRHNANRMNPNSRARSMTGLQNDKAVAETDYNVDNPSDTYTRNNNWCFNIQHRHTELSNRKTFFVRTVVDWTYIDNTVHADSEKSFHTHCVPVNLTSRRAAKLLCSPPSLCLCQIPGCCNISSRYRTYLVRQGETIIA